MSAMKYSMPSFVVDAVVSANPIREINQQGLTHCMLILIAKVIMHCVGVTCSLECILAHFIMVQC
jgi:hypothetical protein